MATFRLRFDEFLVRRTDRFGLLLFLLVASYLVTGINRSNGVRLAAGILTACSLAAGFAATKMPGGYPALFTLLLTALVGSVLVATSPAEGVGMAIGALAQGAVAGVVMFVTLRRVIHHRVVTGQTIVGAIAGYLLIGQVFAWVYLALPGVMNEPVLEPAVSGEVPLYFSYVVLTTLGFGDIRPVGSFAQRVVTIEALSGQVFLAVLVARLVAVYTHRASSEPTEVI